MLIRHVADAELYRNSQDSDLVALVRWILTSINSAPESKRSAGRVLGIGTQPYFLLGSSLSGIPVHLSVKEDVICPGGISQFKAITVATL
jgi:hypothetical protein